MKKLFLILVAVFGFGICANAQLGARVNSNISSICPPLNWKNAINMVFKGPVEQGANVNAPIQTRMEISGGSRTVKNLKEFVDIETQYNNSIISRSSFKTNSGIVGEKVVFKTKEGMFDTNPVFKIQYFFYRGDIKEYSREYSNCVIITCTVLESKANKYLSLFDESVKTFEHFKK